MSPASYVGSAAPLYASTPYSARNGHDHVDSRLRPRTDSDVVNGNVHVNIISESTNSMDVLSGGESDAGDTLSRRNNNSISSGVLGTLKESTTELPRRKNCDISYFVAKELLMTERTYKRDLELVTVSWSGVLSSLLGEGGCSSEAGGAAHACLALEPLVLPAGVMMHRLERAIPHNHEYTRDSEEPEYKKIAELLHDYLTSIADAYSTYITNAATLVGLLESARRRSVAVQAAAASVEATAPISLVCAMLRPLHRALHLQALAAELWEGGSLVWGSVCSLAREQLPAAENHATLCQLQRDIAGYDKLLVPDREFIRLGCLYKHSARGLQQRMLFLFSDVLVITSKCGSGQFRAHSALALKDLVLKPDTHPHTFTLAGDDVEIVLSASNEREYSGWCLALHTAIQEARDAGIHVDTELTTQQQDTECTSNSTCGGGLAHVCWHRGTSLDRDRLYLAMRSQLSGYVLRKFKKSPGWQKLWVVFAACALYFYKSWQDDAPLASLPLLGYSVGVPSPEDKIDKEFVFKLQYKNHVYFFRADSHYTYRRWTEVLQTAIGNTLSKEET